MGILSAFPGKAKPKLQSKSVSPSTSQQTVTADSEYDGLEKVTVNAMKLQSKTVTPTTSQQIVKPDSSYNGLSQLTVNRIPSSYVQPSYTQGAKVWTPGTAEQSIPAGTYCSGKQTIQGDANWIAENIRSGVSMWGKAGTCPKGFITAVTPDGFSSGLTFSHDALTSYPELIIVSANSEYVGDAYIQCAAFTRNNADSTAYLATAILRNKHETFAVSTSIVDKRMTIALPSTTIGTAFYPTGYAVACVWQV